MGATEGTMAASMASRANPPGTTAVFKANASTRVINPDGQDVRPGSDEVGMIATAEGGAVGYFKDPVKTAATFREIDGRRYIVPGDYAKVAADGSLILLGRGSSCINTGGEKVFPEEVEEALKRHPDIADCLVVGVPDARFGQRVTAVVSRRKDADLHDREVLDFLRTRLAGFKIPKQIIVVERVERAPNGKADYRWAKALAGA
jgi:fatty-acyl-CoA synthase